MYSTLGQFALPTNTVRWWNKAQGITHPTDLSNQIYRDYGLRYVSIENSATRPIGIGITSYASGPIPAILHTLRAGQIVPIGINSQGQADQFLWLLNTQTGQPVGQPSILQRVSNQFVIRDGLNKWWVQAFSRPSYSA